MILVVKPAAVVKQDGDIVPFDSLMRLGQMVWWVVHVESSTVKTIKPYIPLYANGTKIKFTARSEYYVGDGTYIIGVGLLHHGKRFVVHAKEGRMYLKGYAESNIQKDAMAEVMALIQAEENQ